MKNLWIGIFIFLVFPAFSQNNILLEIGDEKISTEEFLHIYEKNNRNNNISYSLDSLEAYMDLFVNFKLKVVEAKAMGLDTLKSFKQELSGYRSQLAQPYLTDRSIEQELVKEAYERSKYDINVSHILIKLDADISGDDTLKAYNKIKEARDKVLAGEDFEAVARKYSEDESVKYNDGKLGYFTVFGMVYPFETAAYNTSVGDVSEIVRTRFGYHILKVNDKRPAKGSIRVAHIMVLVPKGSTEEEKMQAKQKVELIQSKLDAGEDFAALAKEFSEDKRSGREGGVLPWFSVGGKMIPEFENAAFQLTKINEVSAPLRTSYGYHFIKLLDKETIGSFEEQESKLKNKISNSARASRSKDVLVQRLMEEYNAKDNMTAFNAVANEITDSIFFGTWNSEKAEAMTDVVFSFADEKYTQADFAKYMKKYNRKMNPKPLKHFINNSFEYFKEKMVLLYEERNLENKYSKFRFLMKEYHDGILLFDVTDKMVWTKAVEDSLGLERFYAQHKDNYQWNTRYETKVLTVKDKAQRKAVMKYLKRYPASTWKPLNEMFNAEDSSVVSKEHWTVFEAGESAFADELVKKHAKKLNRKGYVVARMDDDRILSMRKFPATAKKLDEARGIITADYQNQLEQEWVKNLHDKYNVIVHKDVLKTLVKN